MTDFFILKELQKMIKKMPRPRLLNKKGVTVKGYFRPYMSLADYTEACIFKDPDIISPVIARFSSVLGDKGTADTRRNVKSLSVKFMADDNEYDMICHNIPVNILNDENKMMGMFKTFFIKEYFDGINTEEFWRYVLKNNEALPFALMLFSGIGISDRFVDIKYYAVNTCVWKNIAGQEHFVRYKWMPVYDGKNKHAQNTGTISNAAAEFMAGFDPDRAYNGLINAVDTGEYPMYELYIQMIKGNKHYLKGYHDNTIIWEEQVAPYMCAGIMILDKVADSIENERICFSMGNTIDGISIDNDPIAEVFDFMAKTEALERGAYL